MRIPAEEGQLHLDFVHSLIQRPFKLKTEMCNKLATYHSWFAIPFSRNERMPINVPRYLHLNLSKHVMRNMSRFRLRAHTLKVEAAAWLEDGSCVCDQWGGDV